ncbi:MAG: hypothetical protein KGH98_02860 [Candidatus Micrarchaeota archaeon]|nr:hypothetical protein [Candidatus Micrarchaeota archaeon]
MAGRKTAGASRAVEYALWAVSALLVTYYFSLGYSLITHNYIIQFGNRLGTLDFAESVTAPLYIVGAILLTGWIFFTTSRWPLKSDFVLKILVCFTVVSAVVIWFYSMI